MAKRSAINRRSLLKATGSLAGLAAVGGVASAETVPPRTNRPKPQFNNADFYDKKGRFLLESAKDAVLSLCNYHGYPIFPTMRENLWVSDYGVREFTRLGLAAFMFVNNEEDRYMMFYIFLLPNHMLP